jgi:hypothetical protein
MTQERPLITPEKQELISINDKDIIAQSQQWEEWEVQEILEISAMLDGPIGIPAVLLIWGKPRSGKTMFMVWLLWKLRKYFGMHTVIDSPYLTPAYGPFHYMSDKEFIKERVKINRTMELYERLGKLDELEWKDLQIKLFRAGVGWDEAYDKISVHQTSDKIAREYNNEILQYGHNECVFCIISPDPRQINRQYASQFATHTVCCTFHKNYRGTGKAYSSYEILNRTTKQVFFKELRIEKWGQLYKTKGLISSKVSFKKFKNIDLDEEDEQEIEQWLNRKKGELNAYTKSV